MSKTKEALSFVLDNQFEHLGQMRYLLAGIERFAGSGLAAEEIHTASGCLLEAQRLLTAASITLKGEGSTKR